MTEDQLALLEIYELVLPQHEQGESLEQRFRAFHEANPWVYEALVTLTRDYVRKGAQRVSIGMLCEVIRYQYGRTLGDTYKLNNNHRAFYARLLMHEHPEWDGLFEIRQQRSAA